MNTTLATIQRDELATIQEAARILALSDYFDGKGDTPKAVAMIATKILAGRELGFGPFASANGIHIISGKPSVSANLMATAVKSSTRYDYKVKEMTNDKCSIEFFERDGATKVSLGISEFNMADATKANVKNLATFPRNMLFARAMSNGVRWFCPDVFNGNAVYMPEELGAQVDGDGNVVDVAPRVVVEETGEILPVDNPFNDVDFGQATPAHPVASQRQRNHMHALGMELYRTKEAWEIARPRWALKASGDKVDSTKELSPEQIEWVVEGLAARIAKRAAEQAQQPVATVA